MQLRAVWVLGALLLLAQPTCATRNDDGDDEGGDDGGDDGDAGEDEAWEAKMNKLKSEIMSLSPGEVRARFGSIRPKREAPPRQHKVDHLIVLYMENHAADQVFGCMDLPGFDGIPAEGHQIPKVPDDPALGVVNVSCGTADYVCKSGPTYDKFTHKFRAEDEIHAQFYPYGGPDAQNDKYSYIHGLEAGDSATAVRMYSPEQLPIKHALAKAFGVFNKMYTAVPSASSPNHLFTQSATSCGMKDNLLYDDCGGPTKTFPQMTIYDNLRMQCASESTPRGDLASAASATKVLVIDEIDSRCARAQQRELQLVDELDVRSGRPSRVPRRGPDHGRQPVGDQHSRCGDGGSRTPPGPLRLAADVLRARGQRHATCLLVAASAHSGVRPSVPRRRQGRAAAQGRLRGPSRRPQVESDLAGRRL